MALPSTIYRTTVQLADIDRSIYETLQTTVARHPSETEERLIARLLALALFYEPDLGFTQGISATDEPDLWLKGADGRVQLWVEVGLPDAERIIKAARHAERVALLACGRTLPLWERNQLTRLAAVANLTVLTLDQEFITRLVSLLERVVTWDLTITEGTVYLQAAGESLATPLLTRTGHR